MNSAISTPKPVHRVAFTLIELLVTMSIIAVIAALLMPALTAVNESMYRTRCINNLRTLTRGVASYTIDHGGYLPYPNWGTSVAGWLYTPPNYNTTADLQTGQIWPYISTPDVYRCVLDKPTPDQLTNRAIKNCSYCMNGAVCGYGALDANASPNTYPISRFPANSVCFWEQDDGNDGFWFNDGSNQPDEGISQRHKGGAIVACFDGHVEWLTWDAYNAEKDLSPGRFWCNPGSANGH